MAPEKAGQEAADLIAIARPPRVCDVPQPAAHGKQFRPREVLPRSSGLGCPGPRAFQPGHIPMQPRRLGEDVVFFGRARAGVLAGQSNHCQARWMARRSTMGERCHRSRCSTASFLCPDGAASVTVRSLYCGGQLGRGLAPGSRFDQLFTLVI